MSVLKSEISIDVLNDERVLRSFPIADLGRSLKDGIRFLRLRVYVPTIVVGRYSETSDEKELKISLATVLNGWYQPRVDVGFYFSILGFGFGVSYQWGY